MPALPNLSITSSGSGGFYYDQASPSALALQGGQLLETEWVPVGAATNLSGIVRMDQPGSLVIEQSLDGKAVDVTTTVAVSAPATVVNVTLHAPFARLGLTNTSGSDTTTLKMRLLAQ